MTVARPHSDVVADLRLIVATMDTPDDGDLATEAADLIESLVAERDVARAEVKALLVSLGVRADKLDKAEAVIAEVRAAIDQYEGVSSPPLGLHACLSAIAEAVGR